MRSPRHRIFAFPSLSITCSRFCAKKVDCVVTYAVRELHCFIGREFSTSWSRLSVYWRICIFWLIWTWPTRARVQACVSRLRASERSSWVITQKYLVCWELRWFYSWPPKSLQHAGQWFAAVFQRISTRCSHLQEHSPRGVSVIHYSWTSPHQSVPGFQNSQYYCSWSLLFFLFSSFIR